MFKKWTDYLNEEVYKRLCNCTIIKSDIKALVNAKRLSYKERGKEREGVILF